MKHSSLIIVFILIGLVSCNRNKDTQGSNPGTLLSRIEEEATDFTKYYKNTGFAYNADRTLAKISTSESMFNSAPANNEMVLVRNSNGIIEQLILTGSKLKQETGLDNMIFHVRYDDALGIYLNKVAYLRANNISENDSISYTYNSQKQIVKEELFISRNNSAYSLAEMQEYAYQADLLTQDKITMYSAMGSSVYVYNYQYDDKINPLTLGVEGFILNMPEYASPHNIAKASYVNMDNPEINDSEVFNYLYNDKNRPSRKVLNITSETMTTTTFNTRYFYQ